VSEASPGSSHPLILIGGNGFIGRAYAAHLHSVDREVHIVTREDWKTGRADDLADNMAGRGPVIVDFAYATVPSTSFADPVGDFSANLGATIRHLEFARRCIAERHLFVSSGGAIYGDQGDEPVAEEAPKEPISPYGITKLASEHYAAMYRRLGVPSLVVRPSNVYGPGQEPFRGQGLAATAFGAALRGDPLTLFGDGSQRRDYLFIDDLCASLDAVLARGEIGQAYNLGCGNATSASELLSMIGRITARDGFPLSVLHAEARTFDVHSNLLDVSKLRDELGWQPRIGLEDGLERTWRWLRAR
jgi:UDP-glucose 4-epimerase